MPADPDANPIAFQRSVSTPGKKGPKDVMQEAMNEGLALRGFQMGLGYDTASIQQQPPQPPVRATEAISLNVGDIFNGMANLNMGLANKLLEKKEEAQNPAEERLFTYLLAQLDRLQDRQDSAQQQQDPLSVAFDNLDKYSKVVTSLQQREPHNMQLTQAGINIESLRIQAQMQDSRQQHEEQMETMRRQWEREDKRWLEEFKLKVAESSSSQKRAQEAGGFLQDLAGAFAGALEPSSASPPQSIAGRPPRLKTFKCQPPHGCGAVVQVPAPNSVEAICANCGLTWDLTGEDPPPPPDLSPVLPPRPPPADAAPPMQLSEEEMDR